MIHEIFPHRFNNHFLSGKTIGPTDLIFHFKENSLLLKQCGEEFEIPRKKDFPQLTDYTEKTFLFSLNEFSCFLIHDEPGDVEPGFIYHEINFFRTMKKNEIAWASIAAFHLLNWYRNNKYCGRCGAKTFRKSDERAISCPVCNNIVYPKISPAVIVAIVNRNKILLARNSNFPGKWYSLIAGYADIGESLEEALVREVREETGLDIKNIRYYKSQPWPLSGSMMVGYIAEADDNQSICIDENEIAEASWFTRGNLPEHPTTISIAGEMIEKFERGEL